MKQLGVSSADQGGGKRRTLVFIPSHSLTAPLRRRGYGFSFLQSVGSIGRLLRDPRRSLEILSAMKSFIARFVTDQSGAVEFEDGLTVIALIVGFICAIALLHGTVVQLYAAIFGMLPG